jgi:hypothetical protein
MLEWSGPQGQHIEIDVLFYKFGFSADAKYTSFGN